MTLPIDLRVEHLDEPLGMTERVPRLSWRLPAGAKRQRAYRVRAGAWDSGIVESEQSVFVPYAGPPLRSSERVAWTVKVWTDIGESDWAEPGWWEMGLLDPGDWVARWIEPAEPDVSDGEAPRPAYLLRRSFTVDSPIVGARMHATAHGIYELFLNGVRVGDCELTPGYTSYGSILQVQTYDVGDLVRPGRNTLGAILSDGWFRGQNGGLRLSNLYGDHVALLAQLHVHHDDDVPSRIATGPEWMWTTGAIQAADLMEGQVVDHRVESDGHLVGWTPVRVRDHALDHLCSSPAPPVRRVEEVHPVAVTARGEGRYVVDLGQNINGWARLTNLGPRGTTVTLTHGEALDRDGDVTQGNIKEEPEVIDAQLPWDASHLMRPFQTDVVTSAGTPDECFEPRHTTHGFRYVRIDGHPGALSGEDITGVVVHTDLRRTGWFECSEERINRLHEAAVWSLRGNACDLPVDCPTRERSGWTGDWQIFVPTAAFLFDVAGFSTKWLRDLAAEQWPDGVVLHCVPQQVPMDVVGNPVPPGSAGWGDAAVIVPWEIYRAYGDTRLLEEQWSSMCAWVDYAARAARDGRHPDRARARPTPAPHEAYLWDTGFHYGEWLEPGATDSFLADDPVKYLIGADEADVATAYLHYSSRLLAQIANILGRDADARGYQELAAATRAAWQAEFAREDGTLARDTQAAYVRALAFDLIPQEQRAGAAERLVELIRDAGTHLGTGFLATPYLLPVLADNGHLAVAYELLLQDTAPSWLAMIQRGATTIWESWNGIDEAGDAHLSLNHYSKGAVVSFLHSYVAGIRLLDDLPAYRRFRVAPCPGGGIAWARGVHDSPYGRIEAAWRIDGDRFTLDVTVPPGTSAEVVLPDGSRHDAHPGSTSFEAVLAVA